MILDDRPVIEQMLDPKPAGLAAAQAANEDALAAHNRPGPWFGRVAVW